MSTVNDQKRELLAKARARKAELANTEPSENAQRRKDQIRRVKSRLRRFILDHGIEVKDAGKALGYESVFKLPRHLGPGKPDIEDFLAMAEYFEDFDPTTLLRDVVLGIDEHPDEVEARREGTISPDGERVAVEAPEKKETIPADSPASFAPSAPSPQEEEEIVVIQPDAVAPPPEEDEPTLDTDEGLRAWANRFGFSTGA